MFKNRPIWNFFKRLFSRKATLREHEELCLAVERLGKRMRDWELKN